MSKNGGRRLCFFSYLISLMLWAAAVIGLGAFCMTNVSVTNLQLWQQFDPIPNLLPLLVIGSAGLTLVIPICGFLGNIRNSQIILTAYMVVMVIAVFLWLGIGGWCASVQPVILDNVDIIFNRARRDASPGTKEREFLSGLAQSMPRLNSQLDFTCCQETTDQALFLCSQNCADKYKRLFEQIVFPVLYAVVFGSGLLCTLGMAIACLVCFTLDDVNPAF